jgi:hypothetical protein
MLPWAVDDHDIAMVNRLLDKICKLLIRRVGILLSDATSNFVVVKVHGFTRRLVARHTFMRGSEPLGEISAEVLGHQRIPIRVAEGVVVSIVLRPHAELFVTLWAGRKFASLVLRRREVLVGGVESLILDVLHFTNLTKRQFIEHLGFRRRHMDRVRKQAGQVIKDTSMRLPIHHAARIVRHLVVVQDAIEIGTAACRPTRRGWLSRLLGRIASQWRAARRTIRWSAT